MLARVLDELGIDSAVMPPIVLSVLIEALSHTLLLEQHLGITIGHAETLSVIANILSALDLAGNGASSPEAQEGLKQLFLGYEKISSGPGASVAPGSRPATKARAARMRST